MNEPGRSPDHGPPLALLEHIHAGAPLMVMKFTGAGAEALYWLHSVAGSSRTVLEAVDHYTTASLIEAVGFTPKRFASSEVAAALAEQAQRRASALARANLPTFGLGLSAAIATDRTKRGEHRCEAAVHDTFGIHHYSLRLAKGERDRAGEERVVSSLVMRAVADAKGVLGAPLPELVAGEQLLQRLVATGIAAEFEAGRRSWFQVTPAGEVAERVPEGAAILSGAFNPVHHGHIRLAEAAGAYLGSEVVFELPLANADKEEIGLAEARRRAAQFLGNRSLLLTRSPLFNEKARLFPGHTFVVGVDTAVRLLERRFYGSEESRIGALEELRTLGARFLVAGRRRDGRFLTLEHLDVPAAARELFQALPEDRFHEDISSSQLRDEWPSSVAGDGDGNGGGDGGDGDGDR
ncbi:MAG: hypothetical protein WD314_09880 [Trueperaceae bacterium]